MGSSVHIENKQEDILILDKGLRLHYNGSNSFLFVNATKMYQYRAKDSEIKKYPLCLGNISGDFPANSMKKTELNECAYDFSVNYKTFDAINIIDMHKYLMKKDDIK